MTRRLFTPSEANRTLPLVRSIVRDILETGSEYRTLGEQHEASKIVLPVERVAKTHLDRRIGRFAQCLRPAGQPVIVLELEPVEGTEEPRLEYLEVAASLPEATLLVADLVGGWPGGFMAQRTLRHKTRKWRFQLLFWAIVVLWQWAALEVAMGGVLIRVIKEHLGG